MNELPYYQSYKKVQALKIKKIEINPGSGAIITPENENYHEFGVSNEYVEKHKPQEGGYYVRYEDGYESWSPAKTFETGYELLGHGNDAILGYLRIAMALMEDDKKTGKGSRELSITQTETETAILWRQRDLQLKAPVENHSNSK